MNKYRVYSKDGRVERCRLTKVEYSGTFMGDRVVTSSFTSATEIAFEVFDYIEFRGEKFELEMIPTVKKVSSYQYEYDLRFVSLKYELERCMFRDFVPNDNEVVYPTPVTVEFTGKVNYLTERIQACLDRMYGAGVWSIVVGEGVDSEEKNLSLSNQNCWNALSLVNTEYKLNFHINGRTVVVGDSEAVQGVVFEYGKGNGLYEIERAADSDTGIVTKLIAYGGTRNLDYSYPKKPEWSDSVLPNTFILSPLRLMLPSFKLDGKTDYLLASEEQIAKYGIREGVMMYDDIYPTITGATNSKGERIDKIRSVDAITDEETSEFVVYLNELGFDLNDSLTTETPQLVMKTGALQGYAFNIKAIVVNNGSVKLTLEKNSIDNSDTGGYYIPNKDFNMSVGDEFVLIGILMPQTYIRKAEERLLERAQEYLNQYSTTNYSYSIGVDEIFMAKNPSVMAEVFEGKKMKINDAEIGIDEELVTIQSLTIEDGDGLIPRIKVTLNNNPSASTLERIQGQIANIESTANSQYSAQTELAKQYQRKLNTSYFNRLFVAIDANGNEIAPNDTTTPIASVRVNYGLWTEQFLSAKGMNSGGGSDEPTGGATTIGGLRNVAADADRTYDVAKMLVLEADSNLWTLKNLSELVGGLDEAELAEYLTNNNYAKKGDIPSLSGYATEQWVLGKGYLTEHQDLSAYAKKTDIPTIPTKVSAFENDANYATTSDLDSRIDALVNGAPQAYDTLKEIADVLANNINSIDDILTALGTKVSKDDFNTAIANVNNSISALNTELSGKIDLKLDAVTFNELFEKVQLEDGTWAIKAKLGLFSDGFISAKGSNVGGTSSEGGAVALYQLNDVLADGTQVSGAQDGAVFVYDGKLGKWKGIAQSEIVPNLTGYATESWVLSQGFLTQHQDLSNYAKLSDIPTIPTTDINKGVTAYGWGDHSKVGYLTSITSALVTGALGYTPYDSADFTKANIKSTLGISDWALASSKPSYTTKEVAEDTNLYFTNARAVSALKSITDSLGGDISTLQGYFTGGVAKSALKLSDNGSYTAWGQTFFENGVPKTVGGALSGVTTISVITGVSISGYANTGAIKSVSDLGDKGLYVGFSSRREWGISLWTEGNGNGYIQQQSQTGVTYALGLQPFGGNVGIGTTSPQYKLDVNGNVRTTKLVIGNGSIEWDETNKGFKVVGGLYTESYLSAKGANTNGGSTPSGGQYTRLDTWDGYTSAMDGWVLSAKLGKGLYDTQNSLISRVGALEGKATNVSFTQSLTSGTQIGSISIDGVVKNIYAPTIPTSDINKGVTAYDWGNHASVGYAMASALSGYQTKITSSNKLDYSLISGTPTSLKNPTALIFGTKTYDGSAEKTILASDLGALTAHQAIYALTIKNSAGTTQLTYTPNSAVGSLTLTKAMVDLGNVENTALSTWVGTNKITTLGTITTGVWNGTKIANGYLANSAITIAGTSVSLGGSITAATLQSNLGLGTFAYKSSLAFADLTNKPTTIGGYGITDAYTKSQVDSALGGYLPLSGGVMTGRLHLKGVLLSFQNTDGSFNGYLGSSSYNLIWYKDDAWHTLIHSGNIGSQSVASAKKLVTDAGNSIVHVSGSAFYIGDSIYTEKQTHILGSDVRLRYGASATTGMILNSSGNVLIGTTMNRGYKLDVNGVIGCFEALNFTRENWNYITVPSTSGNIALNIGIAGIDNTKMCIVNNGNVGIGTTSPSYLLHVNGTMYGDLKMKTPRTIWGQSFDGTVDIGVNTIGQMRYLKFTGIDGSSSVGYIGRGSSSNNRIILSSATNNLFCGSDGGGIEVLPNGNVGIGTTSPVQKLDVNGNILIPNWYALMSRKTDGTGINLIYCGNDDVIKIGGTLPIKLQGNTTITGTLNATTGIWSDGYVSAKGQNTSSDMRLKNVLGEVILGVKDIANAPSMCFAWKNGGGVDVGSSAQYWQGLLPDAVKERDGMLEMQYANIALLSAIALAKNFETMDERVARLEKENKELRNEINMMKGCIYE